MESIRKSLFLKTAVRFAAVFTVLAALEYGAAAFGSPESGWFGVVTLLLFFAAALALVFFGIHRPLARIFQEMKALLTNRPYKKIFTDRIDEVGVLAHFFNTVTKNIEQISGDIAEGKRMHQELSVGSDIQRRIIPKEMPQIPGIALFGRMRPASEVGGDSFDIITTPQGNTYVYVGDVTGHGVPAALIMMMVNTIFRTFSEIYTSGYDLVVNTNRILKSRIEPRRFMTCVLLRWNGKQQKLYFTGAGHEHILVYRKAQQACEVRQTGGIALGMVADVSKIVKEEEIPLEPGDTVALYSDGIIEAKNMTGEMFGLPRLKASVEQYAGANSPEELFTNVSKDFGIFVGNQVQEDDMTLIVLRKT